MAIQPPAPPREPSLNTDEVSQLLGRFAEATDRAVEAMVDDLVRVRVGPAMNVLSVEILDPALDRATRERLETAIAGAVNIALQRVALAAGQALRGFTDPKAEKAGETSR